MGVSQLPSASKLRGPASKQSNERYRSWIHVKKSICTKSIIKDLQVSVSVCVCWIQDWPSSLLSTNDWGSGLMIGPPWTPPLTDSLSSTALCLIKAQSGMRCLQWKQRLVTPTPSHPSTHKRSPELTCNPFPTTRALKSEQKIKSATDGIKSANHSDKWVSCF